MSEYPHPMTCCDRDCDGVNHCRIGCCQCERCSGWFCRVELDDEGYCEVCAEEARKEEEVKDGQ